MSSDFVIGLMTEAVKIALLISAPMLMFGLVIGLVISIFQSVTQIQEMTLTFIPKIIGAVIAVLIFAPWMMNKMVAFTTNLFTNLHMYIGK